MIVGSADSVMVTSLSTVVVLPFPVAVYVTVVVPMSHTTILVGVYV